MRRLVGVVATLAALLFSTMPLAAHEQFQIIGTIVKFENWQLYVRTTQGPTQGEELAIKLRESTFIQRGKKRVAATELKSGRSVVLDVMGDSPYDDDLYVFVVTLVPPSKPSQPK